MHRSGKMMMWMVLAGISIFLVGCATTSKKMPDNITLTADGAYQLIEFGQDNEQAVLSARRSANKVCQQTSDSLAVIINEKTEYQGMMDPNMGKLAQKAGTLTKMFDKTRKASEGYDQFSAQDYKTTLDFRCGVVR